MLRIRIFLLAILLFSFYINGCSQKPKATFTVKHTPLKNFCGINAFEWDFEDGANSMGLDSTRLNLIKNFTCVRHYMDWDKFEPEEDHYTFSPVRSGGWNYDTIYTWCKAQNIEVLACMKGCPSWLQHSYPVDERDAENVPVRYKSDFSNPESYIEQARAAFQYTARYGNNKSVDPKLIHVDATPRWTADPINQVRIGLGLINYIECDNERDKWWKGDKAHQTGREYAANLSAFYDGNKNKMGPGIGVKNADPSMKVVMCGLAKADPDYVKDMIAWCRENRGTRPDGSVDLPWDVINYHYYCNDADSKGNHQTSGIAPETSPAGPIADDFVAMAHENAKDMPVWITEAGYDLNQESVQKATGINDKTNEQTEADWILRSSLLYSRCGIQKVFYYELNDDNDKSGTKYATSGFVNHNTKTRRPSADYLYQTTQLFGNYTFQASVSSDPIVDRYRYNDKQMFVLAIPDQKGRTTSYQLSTGNADSAYIYTPVPNGDHMALIKKKIVQSKVEVNISETPCFVTTYYIAP